MKIIHTLFLILWVNIILLSQDTYQYSPPLLLEDGWATADLNSMDVNTKGIYHLFNQLKESETKLHSILLIKDNQIILEEYFNGYTQNQQHDLRSVSKSIRSILFGIALDKGFIKNIDDPITKYLKKPIAKKNLDQRKEKITIRHLLTMSAGWDCNDWDKSSKGQEDKVYKKKDWLQYTLDLPMKNDPGMVSDYCSMGVVLLAEIISQASGMSIDQFAEQYLFAPLGISNVSWGHTSQKETIPSAKRLNMIPRDMAKIGQLILQKGKWGTEQIVSEKWIEESTSPHTKITGIDYGFLWWNLPFGKEKKSIAIAATGNGGQYIIVFPELQMLAIFTGGAYNSEEDKIPFAIVQNIFLPAFENNLK